MTGLSSVAGAPLQAQLRAIFDAAQSGTLSGLDPKVINAARMAAGMLRSAVQRVENEGASRESQTAEASASSKTAAEETRMARDSSETKGRSLDVVA